MRDHELPAEYKSKAALSVLPFNYASLSLRRDEPVDRDQVYGVWKFTEFFFYKNNPRRSSSLWSTKYDEMIIISMYERREEEN